MIVFIDDILNGNISELLSSDLYEQTISKIIVWWSVLPMVGLILAFAFIMLAMFKGKKS